MDSRTILERHAQTLKALKRGGIQLGFGKKATNNELQRTLQSQWNAQSRLMGRVLGEEGDPWERLLEWRTRTEGFMAKYPNRTGWRDRSGQEWNAQEVLGAIEKLIEEIETGLTEDEELAAYEDEDEDEQE